MHSLFCQVDWSPDSASTRIAPEVMDDLRPLPGVEVRVLLEEPGIAVAGGGGNLDPAIIRGRRYTIAVQGSVCGGLPANLADSEQAVEALAADPPDGIYNLLIWDASMRRLRVCSDVLGIKPLYYRSVGRTLMLASELKAFRHGPSAAPGPNITCIEHVLLVSTPRSDDTVLEGVHVIPARHNAIFDAGGMTLHPGPAHWTPPTEVVPPESELIEQVDSLLAEATRKWSAGHVRVTMSLSGGIDSRMVLGYLRNQRNHLTAATWGSADSAEVRLARQVARALGVKHAVCPLQIAPDRVEEEIEQFPWWSEMLAEGGGAWTMRPWMDFLAADPAPVAHGFLGDRIAKAWPPGRDLDPDVRDDVAHVKARVTATALPLDSVNRLTYAYCRDSLRRRFVAQPPARSQYIYQTLPRTLTWQPVIPGFPSFAMQRRWYGPQLHLWSFLVPMLTPIYSRRLLDLFLRLPRRYLVSRRLWRKVMRARFPALSQIREKGEFQLPTPQCGLGLVVKKLINRQQGHPWAWGLLHAVRMSRWPIDYLQRIRDHRGLLAEGIRRGGPYLDELLDVQAVARDLEKGDIRLTVHCLMRIYNLSVFLSRFFGH